MSIDLVKRLATFVVLVLVQGLVFNHIHLFNCATPLLYIIMVLHFRRNHPKWAVLLWCFMMGLCVDVFANTPGVAAASWEARNTHSGSGRSCGVLRAARGPGSAVRCAYQCAGSFLSRVMRLTPRVM